MIMKKGIILLVFVLLFIFGCTSQEIKTLQSIEINEYEGKKLSSIGDFRENSIKGPQYINISDYELEITGLVENPIKLNYDEVLDHQKYKKVVKLNCVEGWSANILWEGMLLKDILEKTKPLSEANTIIFYAYDGYSTSFPIEYVMDNDIMIAYKMNDVIMPPERGFPFQLVAESKWGYKWIKWITKIELSDDEDYEGYWEKRGYSDTGNLKEGFLK
ncbi:molybdopterin-dependent oxidoreductase [Candidatus Woesearchaeota archaeon]|nr:molybdopterin-dependent oxidoreductase [Candidatus Woesearchaeota archaeon]